jgi:hypothetical protein
MFHAWPVYIIISIKVAETTGSVAVFLTPDDETESRISALTVYHVPFNGERPEVTTPGALDIPSLLHQTYRRLKKLYSCQRDQGTDQRDLDFPLGR